MGAKIGKNVKLNPSIQISEHDLVNIGDNCIFDHSTVRPFCLETGLMVLDEITIGNNVSVGMRSVVAPGAVLKDDSVLGPLSSSHEKEDFEDPAVAKASAEVNRQAFPAPNLFYQWCIGMPLIIFVKFVSSIPVSYLFIGLIRRR